VSLSSSSATIEEDGRDARALISDSLRPSQSGWRAALRGFSQDKAAVAGAIVILFIALAAIFAPLVSPYDPIASDSRMRLEPMGTEGHILGLDFQGRDMLSRLIWGGRVSLPNALIPVVMRRSSACSSA